MLELQALLEQLVQLVQQLLLRQVQQTLAYQALLPL
jgi:hypothetical protein